MSLVRFFTVRDRTLLAFSRATLRDRGTAWVRLGGNGPGLRIYDTRHGLPFSLRYAHKRHVRIWHWVVCGMPAVGRWP